MPVFGSVAVGLVGLTLLPGKGGRCAFADILYLRCLAAITIILLDFALLLVAARHHDLPNARFAFVKGGELTALIALCLNLLIRVEGRYGRLHVFVAGLFAMLLGFATVHGMLVLTLHYLPIVYDPVALRIDQMLHLDDVTPLAHLLYSTQIGWDIFVWVYELFFVGVALAAVSEFRHTVDPLLAASFLRFLVIGLLGYPLYYAIPAVAPQPFFGVLFPDHLPVIPLYAAHAVTVSTTGEGVFRNTIPSLHAAWTISAFLALRHSPPWHRLIGFAFILVVIVVTLGSGIHYSIDWLSAFPLVLLVRGLCAVSVSSNNPPRRHAVLAGTLLIALWVLAIRGAPVSLMYPSLIWALAIASCLLPLWLGRRLAIAEDGVSEEFGFTQGSFSLSQRPVHNDTGQSISDTRGGHL